MIFKGICLFNFEKNPIHFMNLKEIIKVSLLYRNVIIQTNTPCNADAKQKR